MGSVVGLDLRFGGAALLAGAPFRLDGSAPCTYQPTEAEPLSVAIFRKAAGTIAE